MIHEQTHAGPKI